MLGPRIAAAILAAILVPSAVAAADCAPADPKVIARAEQKAADAERGAAEAQSVAVRSGNPGAQARANQAREVAVAARREVDRLKCRATPEAPGPRRGALRGY